MNAKDHKLALIRATLAIKRQKLEEAKEEQKLTGEFIKRILKEDKTKTPAAVRQVLWNELYASRERLKAARKSNAVPLTVGELKAKLAKYDNDLYVFTEEEGSRITNCLITDCQKQPFYHIVVLKSINYNIDDINCIFRTD